MPHHPAGWLLALNHRYWAVRVDPGRLRGRSSGMKRNRERTLERSSADARESQEFEEARSNTSPAAMLQACDWFGLKPKAMAALEHRV